MNLGKKVREFLSQPRIGHQTFRVPGTGQGFSGLAQTAIRNVNPIAPRVLNQIPKVQTQLGRQVQRLPNVPSLNQTPIGLRPIQPIAKYVLEGNRSVGRSLERAGTGQFGSKGNKIEDFSNALSFLPVAAVGAQGAKVGIAKLTPNLVKLAQQEGKFGTPLRTLSPSLRGIGKQELHEVVITNRVTGQAKRLNFKSLGDATKAMERLHPGLNEIVLPPRPITRPTAPVLSLGIDDVSKGRRGAEAGIPKTSDPARIQEIKNSIAEGMVYLRTGKMGGRKLSQDELRMIAKSVENAQAKIGVQQITEAYGTPHTLQEFSSNELLDQSRGIPIEGLPKDILARWRKAVKTGQAELVNGRFYHKGQAPSVPEAGLSDAGIMGNMKFYRGVDAKNAKTGDQFFSADKSVAGDYGKVTQIKPNEMPKNPLVVSSKDDLVDLVGYKGDPFTEKLNVPVEQRFDTLAKKYAQSKGHDGIIYQNGSLDAPELHKFSVAEQPIADAKPLNMKGNVAKQIDKEINGGVSLAPAKQQSAQLKQSQTPQPTAPDLPPAAPPKGGNTSSLDNIIPQGQKQKGFLENVQTSGKTTDELKTATGQLDQGYTPVTNKESLAKAQETVSKTPNIAKEYVMSKEPPTAEKMATADLLIKKYEAENNIDEAIEVVNSMDRQLREAGQFVQAASIWNKLSPASLTRVAKKAYSNVGKDLDAETEKIIYDKALGIQKITDPEERNKEIFNLLNYVAEKLPPTKGEIFEAYRYQNMLSSPKTQLRNIYSNLLNTLVTRPINLGLEATYDIMKHPFNPMARDVAISDVPRYYKGVFTSVPNSIMAAKEAMKSGSSALKLDLGKGETTIDVLRKQNIPLKYSAVPRFMEGQDRFFSTLIASGEKSRLLRNGLDEATANAQATDLAQKYLYRNQLGKDSKDLPIFARALDSLGKFALEGRKLPIVGKPYSWFVPFVTTPINAAKVMVEHSPLGFVGGKYTNQQLAKATAGSIVVGVGGMLAMQDKTTWAAPTDKKQKELWYATGRKPYSIQIGDKWVPMWYFGPYALALGIPAALKYNYQDSKTAMSDSDFQKITKTVGELSKFVVNQTPLSGVGSFFQMLDGDADITAGNLAGFTLGQVITAQGFIRWVNTLIDPTYRQARGFTETIMKDMPILSKQLKPYTLPNGEESKRLGINSFIPYDVGQVNNEYEPALQGRTAQLQTNAVKNKAIKDAKAEAGGQSTTIDNTIIKNDGGTINLTPPTTGQGIDAFTNENWNYTKAREIWKAKTSGLIDESTASQAYSKLGVDEGDVRYDYIANKTNDIKTQYIMSKNLNHDELMNRLITGRVVSATGKQFAADGVINNLRDEGLITDYEAKALKKLKVSKDGKPVAGAGRTKLRNAKKPPSFGKAPAATAKIKKTKALKVKLGKSGSAPKKIKVKGYDTYERDLKQIARSTGAKV